jgi:hypothetical protein
VVLHLLEFHKNECVYHAVLNEPPTEQDQKNANQNLYKAHFKIEFTPENTSEFVNQLHNKFKASELRPEILKTKAKKKYNINKIFKLINDGQSSDDLVIFCMMNYEKVHNNLSSGMTKTKMIGLLLDHVKKHDDFENLLHLIREENPPQYEKLKPFFELV